MLKIGDVLILEAEEADGIGKYKCKLVDKKDDILFTDYPVNMKTGKTAFLLNGTNLKCVFVARSKSPYMFRSVVLGRKKKQIPMLKLSYPGKDSLIQIQRRQYVRVKTLIDVAVHPLNDEFTPFVAVTDDFSAGGVAVFVSSQIPLTEEAHVCLWLSLPMQNGQIHHLKFISRTVRINAVNEYQNRVAFEFLGVKPAERQLMIRFSFEQQLEQRKLELL